MGTHSHDRVCSAKSVNWGQVLTYQFLSASRHIGVIKHLHILNLASVGGYNIPMKTAPYVILLAMALSPVMIPASIQADGLKLPAVLGDNAVIQRDTIIPIWGWGRAGSRVVVSLGGKTVLAIVKSDGSWRLSIGPFPAGELGDMVVSQGKIILTSKNLASGEVWFCSGQSNMNLSVSGSSGWEDEKNVAKDSLLRILKVREDSASKPDQDTVATWAPSTAESVKDFSAVAYYFGKSLRKELGVPVGLILSAWNGTTAEVWTPAKELKSRKEFRPIIDRWKKRVAKEPRIAMRNNQLELEVSAVFMVPSDGSPVIPVDVAGSATETVWEAPGHSDNSSAEFAVSGGNIVLKGKLGIAGYFSVARPLGTYDKPLDYSKCDAIRLRVRGNGVFNIQVRATDVWDWAFHVSKPFKVTPKWTEVTLKFAEFTQPEWGYAKPLNPALVFGFGLSADGGMTYPEMPSGLFNAMVAPVIPYAIRGVLWYQGESNSDRAEQYRKLLPALVNGWRREWAQGNFPFYAVQIANFGKPVEGVEENDWSELREAQAMAMTLTNTGLATAIDIGEEENIHPKNKREVGRRLSLIALANVYGRPVEYSGPVYSSLQVDGASVSVRYTHGNGLVAREGKPIQGFSLAGNDRVFHPANARIKENLVLLDSPDVPRPVAARYMWARNPSGNLENSAGLPALPFRTDDWKMVTAGKK